MKYFFVSDLHGCEPMLLWSELNCAGFDFDNDTLVIVGDVVDRGLHSMELINGINSLPHVIRLWGNHDRRTRDVVLGLGPKPDHYDKHNGVDATLHSICGLTPLDKIENIWYYLHALIPGNKVASENIKAFQYYCSKCAWALEFNDLIVTHGWLPHSRSAMGLVPLRKVSDLSGVDQDYWIDATWADTRACLLNKIFPEKPMLVGHWWAGDIRARFKYHRTFDDMILDGSADFNPVQYGNVTFIDSCTPVSHTINVYVYETDEEPFVYVTNKDRVVVKKPLSEAGI